MIDTRNLPQQRWHTGPDGGVYVVQFPDRVKIGRSVAVEARMKAHRHDGAQRAVGFYVWRRDVAEDRALMILSGCADRIRATESFIGITFEQARTIVLAVVSGMNVDPVRTVYDWTRP